jgi:hypothetical protein
MTKRPTLLRKLRTTSATGLALALRARLIAPRRMVRNRFSRRSVVGDAPVVVSLTTYGMRSQRAYMAIESIACGTRLPRRIILWVDELDLLRNPPIQLRRLMRRGLEVLPTQDYGPHKKFYPYVCSSAAHQIPMVTCDDDALYPRTWLQKLLTAYQEFPDVINGHRARVLSVKEGVIEPYRNWSNCTTQQSSYRHIVTGVSGAIYPPRFLDEVRDAGAEFMITCPTADDVWLHCLAVRNGYRIRQISSAQADFPSVPGSQAVSLTIHNVGAGKNDVQIRATYTVHDIERMVGDAYQLN